MFMGIALNVSTWYVPRGSRTYETFCFLLTRQTGEGGAKCLPTQQSNSLVYEMFAKLKQSAIPKTVCVFLTC